jgi:lipopolysaccharide transport system permease protein
VSIALRASDEAVHSVIVPPPRFAPVRVRELWEFRELLVRFAARDITLRYRQTALGVIWVVLQPLLAAGIFSFVFGQVAGLPSDGVPYFAFSFAGMLGWNVFASTMTKYTASLTMNSALVSKIFFPRLALPLSTQGSTLLDFAVSLVMMAIILAIAGVTPGLAVLWLPVWLLLVVMLASGLGFMAGALAVKYHDIGFIVPVMVQLLLYATPIAYSLAAVHGRGRWWLEANPLTGIIVGFRWSLLDVARPSLGLVAWSAACALVLFVVGGAIFTNIERQFADVI